MTKNDKRRKITDEMKRINTMDRTNSGRGESPMLKAFQDKHNDKRRQELMKELNALPNRGLKKK